MARGISKESSYLPGRIAQYVIPPLDPMEDFHFSSNVLSRHVLCGCSPVARSGRHGLPSAGRDLEFDRGETSKLLSESQEALHTSESVAGTTPHHLT